MDMGPEFLDGVAECELLDLFHTRKASHKTDIAVSCLKRKEITIEYNL